MALRPGRCNRRIERPFTRISYKVPKKSYAKGVPVPRIRQFEMGSYKNDYDLILYLVSKNNAQIRHNALEAARIVSNKFLERSLGNQNYFLKFLKYPHHVIREKPIAMGGKGVKADRYSQGMRLSYGKASGTAVQIFKDEKIIMLMIKKQNLEIGKTALKKASYKIPISCKIEIMES